MNGRKLQDRIYLSLGLTARQVGQLADAYRPTGVTRPLDKQNRFLRLPATFLSAKGGDSRTNAYGDALWHGIFDASYTQPGDYLVMGSRTFFVASQEPLLPILCVRANKIISIIRPHMQTGIAGNAYGGYISGQSETLMDSWPASVLDEPKSGQVTPNLPTDQAIPYWSILIPAPAGLVLGSGDIVIDDAGRTATIAGCELTNLGWRLTAKMATT